MRVLYVAKLSVGMLVYLAAYFMARVYLKFALGGTL
jgi:hypothetical protein